MKRLSILASSLFLGLVLFSSPARADWHVDFGINLGGGHVRVHTGHARVRTYRPVHVHCRVPVYQEIWIPAAYQTVVVGYDRCGRPIVRTVCVREGYWTRALVGYRCESCGAHL
jgi:hypothetical protein